MRRTTSIAGEPPNAAAAVVTLALSAVLLLAPVSADGCEDWQLVNPRPVGEDLRAAVWAGDRYVAVGARGTLLESLDGSAWAPVPSGVEGDLNGVTWSNGRVVAVGAGGLALLGDNGRWRPRSTGVTADLLAVAAGPNGLVAVGERGTVLVSPDDGLSWTVASSGTDAALRGVTWADSLWVAVGDRRSVLTSPDGVGWTVVDSVTCCDDRLGVAAHGQRVVAVGYGGIWTGTVTDGALLRVRYDFSRAGSAVTWCGERFVVGGEWGDHLSSLDGLSWEEDLNPREHAAIGSLACGPHGLVGVGPGGTTVSSRDGRRLRLESGVTELDLQDVAWDGVSLVALGGYWMSDWDHLADTVLESRDGTSWQVATRFYGWVPTVLGGTWLSWGRMNAVVGEGERFLAVGDCGYYGDWKSSPYPCFAIRTAGVDWRFERLPAVWDSPQAAVWDGQRFLVAGYGTLWSSPDGVSWTATDLQEDAYARGVASDGQRIVVVGERGSILTSPDGVGWTRVEVGVEGDLNEVTWGATGFVAVGDHGVALWSPNGVAWARTETGTDLDLQDVIVTTEGYLAAGDDGLALASRDGRTWQLEATPTSSTIFGLTQTDTAAVAVGRNGLVERRSCRPDPEQLAAGFTWQPSPVEAGVPTRFVDLSLGSPTSWTWSFGDGGASSVQRPVHVYADGGAFTVTLRVSDASVESVAAVPVTVLQRCEPPPPPILEGPAEVESGTSFTLSWTAVPGGHYELQRASDPTFSTNVNSSRTSETELRTTCSWSYAPRDYYRVRAVRECADRDLPGEWSNVLAVVIVPTVQSAGSHRLLVPAAAHRTGFGGRLWRTDLALLNPDTEPATALVFLLDGEQVLGRHLEVELGAGESRWLHDVVAALVPDRETGGGLLVSSDRRVLAQGRVVTSGAAGEVAEMLPADEPLYTGFRNTLHLSMLDRDDRRYTNLDLVNVLHSGKQVDVDLWDDRGMLLRHQRVEVPPFHHVQLLDLLAGLEGTQRATATVGVRSGYGVLEGEACASTVDRASGEPAVRAATLEAFSWSEVSSGRPSALPEDCHSLLAWGNGRYVAGGLRCLASSVDGRIWAVQALGVDGTVTAAGWNGREWVAVGPGVVASSSDGVTWEASRWPDDLPGSQDNLVALAWGGSTWVAVGGTIARSLDGRQWERSSPLDGLDLRDVVWCGGQFVAVGACVARSSDGVTWHVDDAPGFPEAVACGNGRLVATDGWSGASWSDDGIHWSVGEGVTSQLDVAWAGDRFVAPLGDSVATSPDGVRWDRERFTRYQGGKGTGGAKLSWDGRRLFGEGFWWLIPHGPEKLAPAARAGVDARGRRWRTDLELLNLGSEPRSCELELLVPGAGGDPPRRSVTVPGGNALRLDDVLGLFGFEGWAAVAVTPDGTGVEVASRTWADTPNGSLGMAVPGLGGHRAVTDLDRGWLVGLARGADPGVGPTTAIGLASVCDISMSASVELYRGNGEPLGVTAVSLEPRQVAQLDDPFGELGAGQVHDGYAEVRTATVGCAFHAWAVVEVAGSGDPLFIPVARLGRW